MTADPALLQTVPEGAEQNYVRYREAAGLKEGGAYCLFALRPWGTAKRRLAAFAAAAEYGWKAYGMTPVFFLLRAKRGGGGSRRSRETEGASHKRDVENEGWSGIEFVGRRKFFAPEFSALTNKNGG